MDVTHISLKLPRLDPEFHGYRIVQISDIHMGSWISRRQLKEAIQIANDLLPDLITITGDFVTFNPEHQSKILVEELSCLKPRQATLAILGNHDHGSRPHIVRRILAQSGIIDISNDLYTVYKGAAALHIAGIDDRLHKADRLEHVLEQIPASGAAILLAHEPDFIDIAARCGRFDLQLSGHSHGGQIILPGIGSLFLPRMARKYPSGLYQQDGMFLYTNRGIGRVHIPIRYNCPAEITLFTF